MASLPRVSESTDTCEDYFSFKATDRNLQLDGSAELFRTLSSSRKIFTEIIFSFGMLVARNLDTRCWFAGVLIEQCAPMSCLVDDIFIK